jgi:hypothetical protein
LSNQTRRAPNFSREKLVFFWVSSASPLRFPHSSHSGLPSFDYFLVSILFLNSLRWLDRRYQFTGNNWLLSRLLEKEKKKELCSLVE